MASPSHVVAGECSAKGPAQAPASTTAASLRESPDVQVLRAALQHEQNERRTLERALSIAAQEVKKLRLLTSSPPAPPHPATPPPGPPAPGSESSPGSGDHDRVEALQRALDAQTERASSLERQVSLTRDELKRQRAAVIISEQATQRRIADALAARVEDATAAEAAADKASLALQAERRARERAEAALVAELERRQAAESGLSEAKAEVQRLIGELAGAAASVEVYTLARMRAESQAAAHDTAVDDALREVSTQMAHMREVMEQDSRSSANALAELTQRAEDAERRAEAESKQRQAAEAAIVAAVQLRQRQQQALEEGQRAAVAAAEEAAAIAMQRADDESHRRLAAEQALVVANQELKWRREAVEGGNGSAPQPHSRPQTPVLDATHGDDAPPGSPASVMAAQKQEVEFALAVALAEVKKWRAIATSRSAGDNMVTAHHRDALDSERQKAAKLQIALRQEQEQLSRVTTAEARAQAEINALRAQVDDETKRRQEQEAALRLAAKHIKQLQNDVSMLRLSTATQDAATASSLSSSAYSAAAAAAVVHRADEAATAAVAAANRERRLREDRARAKMSGPDSAAAAAVAAAEAIAAAEAAAQQRRQHRAAEEMRARETAAAAARAAAEASAWVAQGGAGARLPSMEAHERAWELFAGRNDALVIRFADIPWPDVAVLISALDPESKPMAGPRPPRSVAIAELRSLQARWHPDRFAQRFAARLAPDERDAILARVTEVASRINALRGAQDE